MNTVLTEPQDYDIPYVSEMEPAGSSQNCEEDLVQWLGAPSLCNAIESDVDAAQEIATTEGEARAKDSEYSAFELDVVLRLRAIQEKLDQHCYKVDTKLADMRAEKTSLRRYSVLSSGFLGSGKIISSGSRRPSRENSGGGGSGKKNTAALVTEGVVEMDSPVPEPDSSGLLQIEPQIPLAESLLIVDANSSFERRSTQRPNPGQSRRHTSQMPQSRSTQILPGSKPPQSEGLKATAKTTAAFPILGAGGGGERNSVKSINPSAAAEEMARAIQVASRGARNEYMEMAWNFLDDSHSSAAANAFSNLMKILILVCILITFLQTMEPSPIPVLAGAVLETCFDCLFSAEIILRFVLCPQKRSFFLGFYNWIDAFSIITLILRANIGFQVGVSEKDSASFKVLLCVVPVVRILKMLRHFQTLQILIGAFVLAAEALPVLLYMLLVIILGSSSMIYIVEPRDNIPTLATAVWLTIVTTTTVGYGDVTPETNAGYTIVAILTVISVLFMAMPLGIIGSAFNITWNNRDRILLTQRTRQRLVQWGYTAEDVLVLFKFMDSDDDGALSLDDFERLMRHMRIGLSPDRVAQLFLSFEDNGSGSVDFDEFVQVFFPTSFGAVFKEVEQRSSVPSSPPTFARSASVRSSSHNSCLPPGQRGASK